MRNTALPQENLDLTKKVDKNKGYGKIGCKKYYQKSLK